MEQVLLVIQVIIAIALVGMVLIQRSDTDGFGLGSGGGGNLLSGRQTANLMTRTTAILAALFIINSLLLSILASNRTSSSIIDSIDGDAPQAVEQPLVPADAKPAKAEKKAAPSVPDAGAPAKPVKKVKPAAAEEPIDETDY